MRTARAAFAAIVLVCGKAAAAGDTPLVDAARAGDAAAVRALIASRADVHQASGDGSTALHWAFSAPSC